MALYILILDWWHPVSTLWPSDDIWWQRSGSLLDWCWLIISEVQWKSWKDNFTRDTTAMNDWNELKKLKHLRRELWQNPLPWFPVWFVLSSWAMRYDELCDKLTHWGRVTHICISNLTIISSDNGLSPGWRQAITWTNAGILLIGALETNVSEILIKICTFSLKKMVLKMSSGKWWPFISASMC